MRIELLDASERPFPGYSGDKAAVLVQSGLRRAVAWPTGGPISILRQPFKISATLEGPDGALRD